jgi:hypothetical protein
MKVLCTLPDNIAIKMTLLNAVEFAVGSLGLRDSDKVGVAFTQVIRVGFGFRNQVCGVLDQRFVRHGLDGDSLLQKPVEQFAAATRPAPVEAKSEFLQVSVSMLQTARIPNCLDGRC